MQAQVYTVGPQGTAQPVTQGDQSTTPGQSLGFGSNIENARLARSAELALQRGDYATAADYAQRAARAAPGDAHLWFLLGYAARLDGKPGLSVESYQRGLHLAPNSLEGLSGLAQTESLMGRPEEAERLLKQVLAVDPRRKDELMLLGDLAMRRADYTAALDWLSKAERLESTARVDLLMALCYQRLKQMDRASHYLELARHHDPGNPEVQRALAGYYREIGNYPEAIASLQSILNPRPDIEAELGFTYQLNGQLQESANLYAKAAGDLPRDLGLQLSAAQAQVAADSLEHAKTLLARAAALDADYYRVHAIRGEIAQLEERPAEAIREYTAALERLPKDPAEGPLYGIQLHMDLMELDASAKDPAGARRQLEQAQAGINVLDEQGSGRAGFLRLRALIRMSAGELKGALGDIDAALALNPREFSSLQLRGDVLMKLGQPEQAITSYKRILEIDPVNRFALTSLGYASRAAGHNDDAEKYFTRLAAAYPSSSIAFLALGDLYTARRDFAQAETAYTSAFALAPGNPLIVAGGMNAAIEARHLDVAGLWLSRANSDTEQEPLFLREKERYLSFTGDPRGSAEVGRRATQVLPRDRDVAVYLGYDLLNLGAGSYDELLKLTAAYSAIFPAEPDIPLLAGYVHKRRGLLDQAVKDFSDALARDPSVVTAYVNRGYVLNDLHQPRPAAADFEAALKREPDNGEAHLGLAYSDLDLRRLPAALRQVQLAEQQLGESQYTHLIRATVYGRQGLLTKAVEQYRAALVFAPDNGALHLGLAGTLYAQRHYHDAITELETAQRLAPEDASVYALIARAYANLQDREQTLRYVELAEAHARTAAGPGSKAPSEQSAIYLATGEALNMLGDQDAAMVRFRKALTLHGSDRVGIRMDIAKVMAHQNHAEDASRQVALALLEAEAGDTLPPTGEQYIEAADVFRSSHEYALSQDYLHRAQAAGAPDPAVRLGLANNYLAIGDTARAQGELSGIRSTVDSGPVYQLLLAQANVYRQAHQGAQALTSFAQASNAAGEDQVTDQALLAAGADEGLRLTPRLSVLSDFSVNPIYEDSTVYVLDAKLDGTAPVSNTDIALLPPPRSSLQTQATGAYHLHLDNIPTLSGFFQVRNAQGKISVPSTNSIVNRNTTDYTTNLGMDPTLHVGTSSLTFNSGVQATLRRDTASPVELDQNLYRVFTYVSTSSFFNLLSVSGYAFREAGQFTQSNLNSRSLAAAVDFRVGAPWSKTFLVTGWGVNDQLFSNNFESFYTSSYIGLEHQFSERLHARAIMEDVRAWRVVRSNSGIAQNVRPAGTIDFSPTRNWDIAASGAYSSTRSFHVYDTVQSGVSLSYARPFRRLFRDESGDVVLQYPIRFSAGIQAETFFNYTRGQSQQIRPYVSITLF